MTKRNRRIILGVLTLFVLVGVLSVWVIVSSGVHHARGYRKVRANLELKNIWNAIDLYRIKKGRVPTTEEGLQALVDSQDLKEIPMDPWQSPFLYRFEGNKAIIMSYGADGEPGGTGEDEDVILVNVIDRKSSSDGGDP